MLIGFMLLIFNIMVKWTLREQKKTHRMLHFLYLRRNKYFMCPCAHYNYIILYELASVCRRRHAAAAEKHNFMRVIDKNDENEDASARRKKHAGINFYTL